MSQFHSPPPLAPPSITSNDDDDDLESSVSYSTGFVSTIGSDGPTGKWFDNVLSRAAVTIRSMSPARKRSVSPFSRSSSHSRHSFSHHLMDGSNHSSDKAIQSVPNSPTARRPNSPGRLQQQRGLGGLERSRSCLAIPITPTKGGANSHYDDLPSMTSSSVISSISNTSYQHQHQVKSSKNSPSRMLVTPSPIKKNPIMKRVPSLETIQLATHNNVDIIPSDDYNNNNTSMDASMHGSFIDDDNNNNTNGIRMMKPPNRSNSMIVENKVIRELKHANATLTNRLADKDQSYMNQLDELMKELNLLRTYKQMAQATMKQQEKQIVTLKEQSAFQRHELSTLKQEHIMMLEEQESMVLEQEEEEEERQASRVLDSSSPSPKKDDDDRNESTSSSERQPEQVWELSHQLHKIQTDLKQSQKSYDELQEKHKSQKETIRQYQSNEKSMKGQMDELKAMIEKTQKLANLQEDYRKDEVDDLRILVDSQDEQILKLQNELDAAQKELDYQTFQSREQQQEDKRQSEQQENNGAEVEAEKKNATEQRIVVEKEEKEVVAEEVVVSSSTASTTKGVAHAVLKQRRSRSRGRERGVQERKAVENQAKVDEKKEEDESSSQPSSPTRTPSRASTMKSSMKLREAVSSFDDIITNNSPPKKRRSPSVGRSQTSAPLPPHRPSSMDDDGDEAPSSSPPQAETEDIDQSKIIDDAYANLVERITEMENEYEQKLNDRKVYEQALIKNYDESVHKITALEKVLESTRHELDFALRRHHEQKQQVQSWLDQHGLHHPQQSMIALPQQHPEKQRYSRSRSRNRSTRNKSPMRPTVDTKKTNIRTKMKYVFDEPYEKGKLGLILQCTKKIGIWVRSVKETSPLYGLAQTGDTIVEIDGIDTRNSSLSEVVRLLSSSSSPSSPNGRRIGKDGNVVSAGVCGSNGGTVLQHRRIFFERQLRHPSSSKTSSSTSSFSSASYSDEDQSI